jgi:glycosyltransferase involved in cell wall biosynthesis
MYDIVIIYNKMADKSRKKVLYIITKSAWGGAGKYVYDLATNLPKGDFEVFVAACPAIGGASDKGELAKKIIETGIPYYEIRNFQRDINIFKEIFSYFEIIILLLKIRPDIIHVNSSKAGGIVGVATWDYKIMTFNFGVKNIFTAHGWAFHESRPKWQILLIKLFTKITCFYYSKIICVSEFDRLSAIKNHIAPARKLITIHNGIDYQKISFLKRNEAQEKLLGKTSPLVIGTIAEWTKNKGLFYFLEALLKIKNKNFDVVLIGSGQNPDKEKMYDFVKNHNLKNIHLIEWIPNAVSYLKAFDIFVLPSLKEGLPYTLLEAGLAELPVISTKVGGIPEIIGHDEGILVNAGDSDVLAEKIEELINNPEKRKLMATALWHKIIGEFSLEKMLISTLSTYK